MPSEIHLIGESHLDLNKFNRYFNAFEKIRPDIISVECDEEKAKLMFEDNQKYFLTVYETVETEKLISIMGLENFQATLDLMLGFLDSTCYYTSKNTTTKIIYSDLPTKEIIKELLSPENNLETEIIDNWKEFWKNPTIIELTLQYAVDKYILKKYQSYQENMYVTTLNSLLDQINISNPRSLRARNMFLDTLYYVNINDEMSSDLTDFIRMKERDDYTIEQLLSQQGKVVHCGGFWHIYGTHNNLYDQLKKAKVKVYRHKLIDFQPTTSLPMKILYTLSIRLLAAKLEHEIKKNNKKINSLSPSNTSPLLSPPDTLNLLP